MILNKAYLETDTSVAGLVKVADVRTSTVGVDLVDGDGELSAGLDLSDLLGSQGVLGVLADIDVATDLSSTARVHDVGSDLGLTNNGSILLAGADRSTVSGNGRVD